MGPNVTREYDASRHTCHILASSQLVPHVAYSEIKRCNQVGQISPVALDLRHENWIQERHEEERLSYDRLREAVKAAWNVIPQTRIKARCQAIIDANGQQILESRLEVIYEYFDK